MAAPGRWIPCVLLPPVVAGIPTCGDTLMARCVVWAIRAVRPLIRRRHQSTRWLVFLLVCVVPLAGCRSVEQIRVEHVHRLDGYEAGEVLRLQAIDGDLFEFDERSVIVFQFLDGRALRGRFISIDVEYGTFIGWIPNGPRFEVKLSDVAQVYIGRRHRGRTIAISATLGGVVIVAFVVFLLWVNFGNSDNDD